MHDFIVSRNLEQILDMREFKEGNGIILSALLLT